MLDFIVISIKLSKCQQKRKKMEYNGYNNAPPAGQLRTTSQRPPHQGYKKPGFQKKTFNAQPKKKSPVSIAQTSKVQDMFLESMKDQGIEISIQMISGKEFSGKISHFDRYIIILDPVTKPKVIYKSGIESIQVLSEIKLNSSSDGEK